MEYHNPVLLLESVDGLNIKPDGIYVDVTFDAFSFEKTIDLFVAGRVCIEAFCFSALFGAVSYARMECNDAKNQ